MLTETFIHIPGIGEATERRIWESGLRTWQDFLGGTAGDAWAHGLQRRFADAVAESQAQHAVGQWRYFEERLPNAFKWRACGDLGEQAVYVDIETTGTGEADVITVLGAYDGCEVHTFVLGQNLPEAGVFLSRFPLWVTYNGVCFDLPVIRRHFPYAFHNQIHVDLRYPLRRLGYKGGLKGIERTLGLERSGETQGLDGWDAVRLWGEYQSGSADALRLLTAYNAEDVLSLKPLMALVYRELWR